MNGFFLFIVTMKCTKLCTVVQPDLLQLAQLFLKVLDFLLLLGDPIVTFLLFHTQFLDDVAVLQLLLG